MSKLMLPDDVAFPILSFLPVKSLLRLRCLSKSFCSLIDNPYFINFHVNLSIKTTTNRSLIFTEKSKFPGSIYEVDLDSPVMCASKMDLQHMVRVPFKKHRGEFYKYCGDIFGTCKGLIAFDDGEDIILWNPSTKKQRIVPKFWTVDTYFNNGFGYDAITNDYKVIIVTRDNHGNNNYSVLVYSLKTHSSKRIHSTPPPYYFEFDMRSNSILVGSYVHWLVGNSDYNTMILAFDLGNEKFNEVPTPAIVVDGGKKFTMVAELGGCLSIKYAGFSREGVNGVDIWIMKEYGVKESWITLFSTSIPELSAYNYFWTLKTLCCTKKGDKVLCIIKNGLYYISYDLKNRIIETLHGISDSLQSEWPLVIKPGVICVRSLVPLSVNNG